MVADTAYSDVSRVERKYSNCFAERKVNSDEIVESESRKPGLQGCFVLEGMLG